MSFLFASICMLLTIQLVLPFVTVLRVQLFAKRVSSMQAPPKNKTLRSLDFACVITAYKNAALAKPLVASLLSQRHPRFMIYLVADDCPEFEFGITDPRFVLLRPEFPLRLKVKSILHALDHFSRSPDFIAVFDADNLVPPNFLEEIEPLAHAGFCCIQGQRTAKNLDTSYAAMDSLGEHYKNYIEREVPFRLGGSAVISGSGMATETALYEAYLASPEIQQGMKQGKGMLQEDKILQNFLLRNGVRIAYAPNATVYDEKVERGEAVETQRSRWLYSYFQNLPNAWGILARGFSGLNFNQLYFGLVTLALPMFIQLGLALGLFLLALMIAPVWAGILAVGIAVFALNILWTLYLTDAPPEVKRVVWQTPKFVWRQFKGLFKMFDPEKHFKHTEHSKVLSIDELPHGKSDAEH